MTKTFSILVGIDPYGKMNLVKSLKYLPFHVIPFPSYIPVDSRSPLTSASPPPTQPGSCIDSLGAAVQKV